MALNIENWKYQKILMDQICTDQKKTFGQKLNYYLELDLIFELELLRIQCYEFWNAARRGSTTSGTLASWDMEDETDFVLSPSALLHPLDIIQEHQEQGPGSTRRRRRPTAGTSPTYHEWLVIPLLLGQALYRTHPHFLAMHKAHPSRG